MKKVLSIILALALVLALTACGAKKEEAAAPAVNSVELKIGQVIGAAHGTKCFSVGTAVIDGEGKIVKAFIDEFQYMGEGSVPVPNSDGGFGSYYAADNKLGSKRDSNEYYTKNLKEKGGATMVYTDNLDVIQTFCEGKTVDELTKVDAVSGCTLTDAAGYCNLVADAAKAAANNAAVTYEYEGDLNVSLKMITTAAHGDKCFTIATALTDGTKIILSYLDEFQYMASDAEGVVAVPNSENFVDYVSEGYVLGSKRQSDVYYTNALKTKASATMDYVDNLEAVQNFVNGKTFDELAGVDAVSGCTLTDAAGYVAAIVEAAK